MCLEPSRRLTIVCAVAGFSAGLGVRAGADVINVPEDQPTIQAAIGVAIDGDEIVVAPGSYGEAIDFLGKAITLRSTDGPAATIIDAIGIASPTVSFVSRESGASVLDGFTITGGSGQPLESFTYGGGILVIGATPTVLGCHVTGNAASRGGGAACLEGSDAAFISCEFQGNSATSLGGGFFAGESEPLLTSCVFEGNSAISGGGIANLDSITPVLLDCQFFANTASLDGAGMLNGGADSVVIGCTFVGNKASGWGAGMYNVDGGSPLVADCRFVSNVAVGKGGGMNNHNLSLPLVVNCLFAGNVADEGAGILNHSESGPTLVNCTVVGNVAKDNGGGLFHLNNHPTELGTAKARNCIAWGNVPNQILAQNSIAVLVTYSLVQDGYNGVGNIDGDPLFVDADGPDDDALTFEDNDYHLGAGSPAIDAGNNDEVPADVVSDLDGNPRFVDDPDMPDSGRGTPPIVDIGAFEHQPGPPCPADVFGNDGAVGPADLATLLANWGPCEPERFCTGDVNGDGIVNIYDLATLLSGWGVCP